MHDIPLGKPTDYHFNYDADLLFPVPRKDSRDELGFSQSLPFVGSDLWTAYELSWLNKHGLPQVAIAEIVFPCEAPNLVESKSFKLYLNSFNQTCFADQEQVLNTMQQDLSRCAGGSVKVRLYAVDDFAVRASEGFICLDQLPVQCDQYEPDAALLQKGIEVKTEQFCSHIFRSLCPVTGQPDWASVYIGYTGLSLDKESLLRYLVSYRLHQGFHEQCVEMIYRDIQALIEPSMLTVSARFVRRGGLDINPIRSLSADYRLPGRQARQ